MFGNLFDEAIKNGLTAIQVIFFIPRFWHEVYDLCFAPVVVFFDCSILS